MSTSHNYSAEYTQSLETNGELGYISKIVPPIIYVIGLPNVKYGEVVYFETGDMGYVTSMNKETCEVLTFSKRPLAVGTQVTRSGHSIQIPAGEDFLGKSIDPLGNSVFAGIYVPMPATSMPIHASSPGIDQREKIAEPFETGVAIVDMMIPLGKGQRELVLGDRQTGKTEFLLQCLFTQASKNTLCIYANIGKKRSDIGRVERFIVEKGIQNNVIIVSTTSTDPVGMIHITPYAAMAMGEFFVSKGRDVLLILDDLSTHAKFYREIALISKKFPGRNSYPGDVFFAHSRLLERAGNFKTSVGVHSLTCLAVAETIESDISGYIQTNLMSITDGHIYFDHELFGQGRRPAVNYFLSVTRVGRQTQNRVRWGINRELSSFLTLYEKTQQFIHFGAEINDGIRSTLTMGSKLLTFFDQPMGTIIDMEIQILMFCLIWVGALPEESTSNLRYLLDKVTKKYKNDTVFATNISNLIHSSDDFNVLLGKLSSKAKDILSSIESSS